MEEKFMKEALKEAKKAYEKREIPVGAIIVKNGKVIAKAYNLKETKQTALAHAEILAIQKANKKMKNWRLAGCDMYITLEPCDMCKEIIKQSRIDNVYYLVNSNCKKVNTYNTNYKELEIDNNFFNEIINNFFSNKR